jgi:hypothetical protein
VWPTNTYTSWYGNRFDSYTVYCLLPQAKQPKTILSEGRENHNALKNDRSSDSVYLFLKGTSQQFVPLPYPPGNARQIQSLKFCGSSARDNRHYPKYEPHLSKVVFIICSFYFTKILQILKRKIWTGHAVSHCNKLFCMGQHEISIKFIKYEKKNSNHNFFHHT